MARTVAQTSHQKKETGQTGKPNGEYALQAADRPGGEGQSEEGTAEQEQKPQGADETATGKSAKGREKGVREPQEEEKKTSEG